MNARPRRRVRTRTGPATPRRAWDLLLALGLALGNPTDPIAAQEHAGGGEGAVASLDVPFMAQEPLLCGGASIAMVARYWGERGVWGEDFRDLVREAAGGIRAVDLAAALEERGYQVGIVQDDPEQVFAALEDGIPPILLLESGLTSLHYVVLVGTEGDGVRVHDPALGPDRWLSREELTERWRASNGWALLAVPPRTGGAAAPRSGGATPELALRGAAQPGAVAAPPELVAAMERLRSGDPAGARAVAAPIAARSGGPVAETATRLLATAWLLEGDRIRALEAWNAVGEPLVDLVRLEGGGSTRYPVAAERVPVRHGEMLTPERLRLARRRVQALPSVQSAAVDYAPVPDGTVELIVSILPRQVVPGWASVLVQGTRWLLAQPLVLEVGPLFGAGDRWRLAGSLNRAQRYFGGSLSAPAPPLPGIATVGVEWRRERFAAPPDASDDTEAEVAEVDEERMRGWLGVEEWIRPELRLGATAGLEEWTVGPLDEARLVSGGLGALWITPDDRAWLRAGLDGWTGSGHTFGRATLDAFAVLPRGEHREWRLRVGGALVGEEAPRMLWPGAGSGRIRTPLLRAHELGDGGRIRGGAFGRRLLHGGVEHRLFTGTGAFRGGALAFVDAARAGARGHGLGARGFVDVGAGLFVELGAWGGELTLAHGSEGWHLSARIGSVEPPR